LDEIRSDAAPFFLFINYMDPHFPYTPRPPYRERFLRLEHRAAADAIDLRALRQTPPPMRLEPGVTGALKDLYEGEVAYLDAATGKLMAALRERGLSENTIVVITSDHGENFGEHDLIFHQFSVHESLLRVPLILHYPKGLAPGRIATPVSIVDLYPTLLALVGLRPPRASGPQRVGKNLLSLVAAPAQQPRAILSEYTAPVDSIMQFRTSDHHPLDRHYFTRDLRSLRRAGFKLIWASDGRHELYELAQDPWETNNLVSQAPELLRTLAEDLDRELSMLQSVASAAGETIELDPQVRRELRALGYLP
jgi:arylsulfatase A-like enzyme